MKRASFAVLFIAICVMLSAETGEEMLKRAISTNPTNSWSDGSKHKGPDRNTSSISAYLWPNGQMYFGNFLNSLRHGYGIDIAPQGLEFSNCPKAKYYVGNFSNNNKNGTGTCYDASGARIYYGEFKDDKPTGTYPSTSSNASYKFQTLDYTSGDKYVGETYNGKRHGYGVHAWKDGGIWIGYWKDGARSGQGIKIDSNGALLTGYWDGDTRSDTAPRVASSAQAQPSNPAPSPVPTIPAQSAQGQVSVAGQTLCYKYVETVNRNTGVRSKVSLNDSLTLYSGRDNYITFTGNACYESNKDGHANNSKLVFLYKSKENGVITFAWDYSDTRIYYWTFSEDYKRLNIQIYNPKSGNWYYDDIHIYERADPNPPKPAEPPKPAVPTQMW